ncbi:MAG: helix-turn-helix transcriptional regulator [Actinomycetota bacterium]|nr:helix-turn-helix transcriptional regulator [Actinomycetota bacterium]
MTETTAVTSRHAAAAPGARLGDRLKLLRVAAGLTQTELAGDRFSKEYVSQIERGKTRPTPDTIGWLAQRLGVDPAFLSSGVSTDERGRVEALLARAEAMSKSYRYKEAVAAYEDVRQAVAATNSSELEVRTRSGEAWARMQEGDVRTAVDLLASARALAEGSMFSDVDRAEIVFRLGVCRYMLASIGTAVALLDEALALAEGSELPCDAIRADIYQWRSRCHRRQRDFEAAREDVEHALELAQGVDDRRKMAEAHFQASLVAERTGHWVLSRAYAENAKNLFQELDDERTVGRLLNNLGGLSLLLGKPHQAIDQLKQSFAVAVEVDSKGDAAQAMGGLATVHLRLGDWEEAESNAREALRLLDGREDFLDEVGQSQIVLGRSLLERDRLDEAEEAFRAADATFEQFSSISHRANAWVALGDLAARRGDEAEAARLYRNAAEALQDMRF